MGKPVVRQSEREAFCRSCDEAMQKGTPMVSFYSHRNQGMWVHLCISCSAFIGKIAVEYCNEVNTVDTINKQARTS